MIVQSCLQKHDGFTRISATLSWDILEELSQSPQGLFQAMTREVAMSSQSAKAASLQVESQLCGQHPRSLTLLIVIVSTPYVITPRHVCRWAHAGWIGRMELGGLNYLNRALDISRSGAAAEIDPNDCSCLALTTQVVQDGDSLADAALPRKQAWFASGQRALEEPGRSDCVHRGHQGICQSPSHWRAECWLVAVPRLHLPNEHPLRAF